MELSQIPLPIQIMALTEAVKRAGVPSKYLFVIAMIWGLFLALAVELSLSSALNGMMWGLVTSMGISVVDSRLEKIPSLKVESIDNIENIDVSTNKPTENLLPEEEEENPT